MGSSPIQPPFMGLVAQLGERLVIRSRVYPEGFFVTGPGGVAFSYFLAC